VNAICTASATGTAPGTTGHSQVVGQRAHHEVDTARIAGWPKPAATVTTAVRLSAAG